jgi:hypothetical protein
MRVDQEPHVVYSAEMVVSCVKMNGSCARAAKGRQGKTREDHGVQSVCVCISVAVDYLREAEWKVCYLGFELFVGFGLGRGKGAGRWTQFDHDPVVIKSGNSLPCESTGFLCAARRSAKILPKGCPWLGCQIPL